MKTEYDLIVVGEGIAGLTCAGEAARLGLTVASFEAEFIGGLVVNLNELQRFDEATGLSGMDHAAMLAHANLKSGVTRRPSTVDVVRPVEGGFDVEAGGSAYRARAVVLATGARVKRLGVPGEAQLHGRGVSHCADCDAPMFTGAEVVVAGGGDWAIQEALVLALECAVVHVLHEGAHPTACAEYLERARAQPRIRMRADVRIEAILGENAVTGVRLRDAVGAMAELPCVGVFPVTGLEPNVDAVPDQVRRDESGFVLVGDDSQTDVPGLWAVGQVRAGFSGWLTEAADEARRVAQAVKASLA